MTLTKRNNLIVTCAWCKIELGTKEPLDDNSITHTYCPKCAEETEASIAALFKGNDDMSTDTAPKTTAGIGKYQHGMPKLHPGEPYFYIRAQDKLSIKAVQHYAKLLADAELHDQSTDVEQFAKTMEDWQHLNQNLVKLPD